MYAVIADDSALIRMILKKMLEKNSYKVIAEAKDGVEAVEMYKEYLPNFITLDVVMPNKDGITAAKEILEYDPTAVPIMITSMGRQKSFLEETRSAGVKSVIIKPFSEEQVMKVLAKALKY